MNVVHILNEIRPSGAEVMLGLAAPFWMAKGCSLTAIATAADVGDYSETLKLAGFHVLHTPWTRRNDASLQQLITTIQQQAPDVVHVHTEGGSSLLVSAINKAGIPVLRTIHNNFPYSGLLRLRKIAERFVQLRRSFCQISISQSVFDNELHRLKNRTTLCWNWFNDNRFRPPTPEERREARRNLDLSDDTIVVLSVGNGNDVKNYPAIIEAVSLLNRKSGSARENSLPSIPSPLLYLMVGNEHPQRLERSTSERLGMCNSVRFCGSQSDVLPYLWAADAFVMPSRYEGFSLSAMEAIATGIPCVFSDCPGLKDFRVFDFDIHWCGLDASSIADVLTLMISNGCLTQRSGANAEAVRREFGVEIRSSEYFRLWKDAARGSAHG